MQGDQEVQALNLLAPLAVAVPHAVASAKFTVPHAVGSAKFTVPHAVASTLFVRVHRILEFLPFFPVVWAKVVWVDVQKNEALNMRSEAPTCMNLLCGMICHS